MCYHFHSNAPGLPSSTHQHTNKKPRYWAGLDVVKRVNLLGAFSFYPFLVPGDGTVTKLVNLLLFIPNRFFFIITCISIYITRALYINSYPPNAGFSFTLTKNSQSLKITTANSDVSSV